MRSRESSSGAHVRGVSHETTSDPIRPCFHESGSAAAVSAANGASAAIAISSSSARAAPER